ncbi:Hypothetical protein LUCI_1276 [Lucifera butyrica]|uniref:Uncharacterized protein n=1 Tax=Lucifera butyrica TaxID=1351585 RepID=A0A498R4L6_9FIRM|nr:C4-type zinc ribbon domain-containing protein [Lucifera butyrica]VBB06065.1 Hypothetical protein LUCI_1276 [Lucifera butyrica]
MKEDLQLLWQLQTFERQENLLKSRHQNICSEEVRQLWQEIKLLIQSVAADREKLVCMKKVCARQETDLSHIIQQYHQFETRLYSGEITNLKEMEQLKTKYDAAKRDIAMREEEVFEGMDESEKLMQKIIQDEKQIEEKKKEHLVKQQQISQEIALIETEVSQLQSQYDNVAAQVDPVVLSRYKALQRKTSYPLAKLENGVCGGCRMSVPAVQLSMTQDIVYCDNCGRILLIE